MPDTLVAIGLNSPRMLSGASGFMSQVSSWLGPPCKRNRTQDRAAGSWRKDVPAHSRLGNDKPTVPSPARHNQSRRVYLESEPFRIADLPSWEGRRPCGESQTTTNTPRGGGWCRLAPAGHEPDRSGPLIDDYRVLEQPQEGGVRVNFHERPVRQGGVIWNVAHGEVHDHGHLQRGEILAQDAFDVLGVFRLFAAEVAADLDGLSGIASNPK